MRYQGIPYAFAAFEKAVSLQLLGDLERHTEGYNSQHVCNMS
jgi:hypothetical protein